MNLERYMNLTDAARRAGQIAACWSFRGTEETSDYNNLLAMADIHDNESGVVTDEETFYLVASNGAIGFTEDKGEEIEWLYLPIGHEDDDLPDSLAESETGIEAREVRFCTNCGNQLSDGARFCRVCGTPVQQPQYAAPVQEPTPAPVQQAQYQQHVQVQQPQYAAPVQEPMTAPVQHAQYQQPVQVPQPQYAEPMQAQQPFQMQQMESLMPNMPPMSQIPQVPRLSGIMAAGGAGEVALGSMSVNLMPPVLAPLMTLKNMVTRMGSRFASLGKNPAALICAGVMAVIWMALGIMKAKGIGGTSVTMLSSFLLVDNGPRSVVGSLGSVLGQSVLLGTVISLVRGGGRKLSSGMSLLPTGINALKEDKVALSWAVAGVGIALLLYEIFVGNAHFTSILGALAPASLVLMSWGGNNGMIYRLVQSVTANKVGGMLQENKSSLSGLYFGLTSGFALALPLAIAGQNSLIIAFGLFLPLLGILLYFIFQPKGNR